MSKKMYFAGFNPLVVPANVHYNDNKDGKIIHKPGDKEDAYDGIEFGYISLPVPFPPQTVIVLKSTGSCAVQKIKTTQVDNSPLTAQWDQSDELFIYSIPSSCMNTSHHTIHFRVKWADGSSHDPQIIINPSNGGPGL